ncbi:LysR family transcriptional regulator [Erwinia endophytica]|uniref:LysR family transcriptional regulator n=1 Tax=Erwinia endophytica TaxID=1563158 RepID=UPI001265F900|nr:LysR family transcriptional regulator [Erwinia endophytica]KAB8306241.1 LysR family transcriptional regulator [Erwinia endophytica]
MELKWFEDFLSIARCCTFTRAADERHITQSALSRRIRQLEAWLGVPLFDRKTYPVTLTPEGQAFLLTASETVFAINHLRSDLHRRYEKRTSVLRFAMLNTLSLTFFPTWIEQLKQRQPLGYIRLCDQKPTFVEQIALLHGNETDFLLTYAHDSVALIQQLQHYPMLSLGTERAIAVCRPDSTGKPLYAVGVSNEPIPFLSYGDHSFFAHALARSEAIQSLPLVAIYENGMSINLKAMTMAGSGVAWLPESLLQAELESGALVRAGNTSWDVPLDIRLYRQPVLRAESARLLWQCAADSEKIPSPA